MRFIAFTAAASLIWNTAFALSGYVLGESWPVVESHVGAYEKTVIVLVAIAALAFVGARDYRLRFAGARDHHRARR